MAYTHDKKKKGIIEDGVIIKHNVVVEDNVLIKKNTFIWLRYAISLAVCG